MGEQFATQNSLLDRRLQPALDILRKVVFRRDPTATHVELEDIREAMKYLVVTHKEAGTFLQNSLGKLPEPASPEEHRALLAVQDRRGQKLRFTDDAGLLLVQGLERYDCFLAPLSPQGREALVGRYEALRNAASIVPGQSTAAAKAAMHLALQLSEPDRKTPAVLLLHGPEGCGTREMALALAEELSQSGYRKLSIDCRQYRRDEASAWDGGHSTWTGARPGKITGFIYQHQQSVVVFHQLDRTTDDVMERLNAPLTDGIWNDRYGLEEVVGEVSRGRGRPETPVNCGRAVFILTASTGSGWYDDPDLAGFLAKPQEAIGILQEAMREATHEVRGNLVPVFNIVLLEKLFEHLVPLVPQSWDVLLSEAKRNLARARAHLAERFTVEIDIANAHRFVAAHLLRFASHQGLAATSQESFERVLVEAIGAPVLEAKTCGTVRMGLAESAAAKLDAILADLGPEPANALRKRRRMLRLEQEATAGNGQVRIEITGCSLERVHRFDDYHGQVHLEAVVPKERLDDVAGHTDCKRYLRQIIEILMHPQEIDALGIETPKGVVLYGPPGSGKSLLARAFAGEARLPIIAVAGSDLLSPDRLAETYALAHSNAPCILFIDEIDAIGRRGGSSPLHDALITKMLAEIQGYRRHGTVFHVLATNRLDDIDPALLRPGRIDRVFEVGQLDSDGRRQMLRHLLKVSGLARRHLETLVDLTAGMTGAEIEQVTRECGLRRIHDPKRQAMSLSAIREEVDNLRYGHPTPGAADPVALRRVAYHEAGHALVSALLRPDWPIEVISVTPRGNLLGRVQFDADRAQQSVETPTIRRNQLAVTLAGRAAEIIAFGEGDGPSDGGAVDLANATRMAWNAVTVLGLDPELPLLSLGFAESMEATLSEPLRQLAWTRAQSWLLEAQQQANELLKQNWPTVDRLSAKLLKQGSIDGEELRQLMAGDGYAVTQAKRSTQRTSQTSRRASHAGKRRS